MARVSRTAATRPGSFLLRSTSPRGIVMGGSTRRTTNVGPVAHNIGGSVRKTAGGSAGKRAVTPGRAGGK